MLIQTILLIVIIALNAVLSAAETAITGMSDSRLEKLAASGSSKAKRLRKLTAHPAGFMETMQTAMAFISLIGAVFAGNYFSVKLTDLLCSLAPPLPETALRAASLLLITALLTFIILVFGRVVPGKAAARSPEKNALRLSRLTAVIACIFQPLVKLTNITAGGILRLIGIDPDADINAVTEEEILMMSDAGAEKGTIDEDENRIIKNVFAFDDLTAGQICTHRTDVSVLWENDDISVWEETIHRTRHSVFPLCGESVDNVIGVLDAKDYFRLDDKSRRNIMENAVNEPYFVHENMKADRLFEQMKQKGADHFAVVVDEYGGMSGILTVTDLVEQLVGEFADDDDNAPSSEVETVGRNLWHITGITPLSDVSDELEVSLPADKYDTFGGYVIAELGYVPKDGTQVSLERDGLHIDVLEIRHHRIELCRVCRLSGGNNSSGSIRTD